MSLEIHSRDYLPKLTKRIVQSYQETDAMHHLDHCPLPNHDTIDRILDDLKEILFPGYRRRDRLNSANIVYHVGEIVDRLHEKLSVQISKALCHTVGKNCNCTAEIRMEFEQLGHSKAIAFLEQLPEIRRQLKKDVQAAYAGDPACRSLDEVIFCYPGLESITIHRLAHALHLLNVPLIPRMMSEKAHSATGIDIHPGASIGEYFFIDHGTGIVIGETCEIGNWVKLYQGVTLGALSFPKDANGELVRSTKRHPTIGDNVIIYANATVLGGDTVLGKDCVIGSNVWITYSVQPGTVVTIEKPQLKIRSPKDSRD